MSESGDSDREFVVKNDAKKQCKEVVPVVPVEKKAEAVEKKAEAEAEPLKKRTRPKGPAAGVYRGDPEWEKTGVAKAHFKRAELKPVNEERRRDEIELKTLKRLVEAKEAKAKVEEMRRRLAELDETIESARAAYTKTPLHVAEDKKKSRKSSRRGRRTIIIKEQPETETEECATEDITETEPEPEKVVERRRVGRPRYEDPRSVARREAKAAEAVPSVPSVQKLALKEAIQKQTNQLLYNSLFGM